MSAKKIFHLISYLQYPLVIARGYYCLKPYWNGFQLDLSDINNVLIFFGLSISFSTLQDTTKTQNKLSRKVWESPVKGKIFLTIICLFAAFVIGFGLYGIFKSEAKEIREIAFGCVVLGTGLIGLIKAALDIFENHRKDKKNIESTNFQA